MSQGLRGERRAEGGEITGIGYVLSAQLKEVIR